MVCMVLAQSEESRVDVWSGLIVMLEKPITTTYEESLQLIEIAKENNVVLTTYQNRRW